MGVLARIVNDAFLCHLLYLRNIVITVLYFISLRVQAFTQIVSYENNHFLMQSVQSQIKYKKLKFRTFLGKNNFYFKMEIWIEGVNNVATTLSFYRNEMDFCNFLCHTIVPQFSVRSRRTTLLLRANVKCNWSQTSALL